MVWCGSYYYDILNTYLAVKEKSIMIVVLLVIVGKRKSGFDLSLSD